MIQDMINSENSTDGNYFGTFGKLMESKKLLKSLGKLRAHLFQKNLGNLREIEICNK